MWARLTRGRSPGLVSAPLAWALFGGLGLIVGVAALLPAGETRSPVAPAARLIVRLPEPLAAMVMALLTLAALLLFLRLLPRDVRRRRKEDDEIELCYEPPKMSPWLVLALWMLLLAPVGVVAYALWTGWASAWPDGHSRGAIGAPPRPLPVAPEAPGVSEPAFTIALAILASAAALAAAGLMLWIYFGDRLAGWWAGPPPADASDALDELVEERLDDFSGEPDPRVAIVKCYRRFERLLAASHVPRAPWQTPTEFLREALRRLPLPAGSVERLTRLFEFARFSHHRIGVAERDAARAALGEIEVAIGRRNADAPSA